MKSSSNIFKVNPESSDRKQVFIDATICCLAEHGYKGTTVRKIAKYAQVSPSLLTHYYEGKEVLIAECYMYLSDQFLDNFKQEIAQHKSDPIKALQIYISNFFEQANLGEKVLRVWITFWTLTLTQQKLRLTHNEIHNQYINSIEEMLIKAYSFKNIDDNDKNTRHLAMGISALLDGLWLESCLDPDNFSKQDNLEIIYNFVESTTGLNIYPANN